MKYVKCKSTNDKSAFLFLLLGISTTASPGDFGLTITAYIGCVHNPGAQYTEPITIPAYSLRKPQKSFTICQSEVVLKLKASTIATFVH